ncbi:hypothetical protein JXA88_10195 [Candidatus Fermentibacteria bacterium]|nr:hypothetical protein [Candidatus Fermentibacteria bacterium]
MNVNINAARLLVNGNPCLHPNRAPIPALHRVKGSKPTRSQSRVAEPAKAPGACTVGQSMVKHMVAHRVVAAIPVPAFIARHGASTEEGSGLPSTGER